MGGILGVLGGVPSEEAVTRLQAMASRSPYRGAVRVATARGAAVAVQEAGGDADLWSDVDHIFAVHGYLGNRKELGIRLGLDGDETTSLAHWLALAWTRVGADLVPLVRGEFALLVFDVSTQSVLLARDVAGLRPLHLAAGDKALLVASEVRQVLAGLGGVPRLDEVRLAYWLAGVLESTGRTFFTGVRHVLPGRLHTWEVAPSPVCRQSTTYWEPPATQSDHRVSSREVVVALRDRMTTAVSRSIPDGPFAVAVSGGLDSSGVWVLLDLLHRQGDPRAGLGRAYSLGFPGLPWDETDYIRLVHGVGSRGDGVILDGRVVCLADGLTQLLASLDCPAMPTLLHLALVARSALDDGRRVLLLGSGGNEWLSGDLVYLQEELLAGRLLTVIADLLRLQLPASLSRRGLALRIVRNISTTRRRRAGVTPAWLSEPYRGELDQVTQEDPLCVLGGRRLFRSNRERMLRNLRVHQAGSLLGREQYAAQLGVELRHPLFDLDLMAFCFTLPGRVFVGGVRPRHLQRSALADLLPARVRDRREQSYLTDLVNREMRQVWNALPRRARDWSLVARGIVDARGLDNLLDRYYTEHKLSGAMVSVAVSECFVRAFPGE